MEVLEYYANNQWDFDNKHAIIIRARMNEYELSKYKVDAKVRKTSIKHLNI